MLPAVNNHIVIALDAMGGDFAPLSVIQGASFFLDNLVD
ncbi:MAG: phosphate acyltransferase, partial [Wolbachia sp.]